MTYIARSPVRYIDDKGKVCTIAPGRRVPADHVDDDLLAAKAIEQIDGDADDAVGAPAKPLSRMNRAELDAIVAAEGVDIGDASTNPQIVTAIETARADRAKG